jgi:hypothetical protein
MDAVMGCFGCPLPSVFSAAPRKGRRLSNTNAETTFSGAVGFWFFFIGIMGILLHLGRVAVSESLLKIVSLVKIDVIL